MTEIGKFAEEIEIKLDLQSFSNYLKLIGFLGRIDRETHQVNTFFDTEEGVLAENGWALRVRVENERGLVTLKGMAAIKGAASLRRELESEITRGEANEIIHLRSDLMKLDCPAIAYVRDRFGEFALMRVIQFDNDRQCKEFKIGDGNYLLEIDKTKFSDGSVDYELEVELPEIGYREDVEDKLQKLLASLSIPYIKQPKSKLSRALSLADPN